MRFSIVAVLALASAAYTSAAVIPRAARVSRIDSRQFEDAVELTARDIIDDINDSVRRAVVGRRHARDFNKREAYVAEPMKVRDINDRRAHARDFPRREKRAVSEYQEAPSVGRVHSRDFKNMDNSLAHAAEFARREYLDAKAARRFLKRHPRDFSF